MPITRRKTTKTPEPTPAAALAAAPSSARVAPPVKRHRRPILTLLGIGLVLLAGLGAALAYRSLGTGHDVVAVRQTVHRGEVIDAKDLMTVRIGIDPALHPLAGDQMSSAVGKRAAWDLPAGGVVTQDALTPAVIPPTGSSLVGVAMTPAQMPSEPLRAGDRVRLVAVPKQGTETAAGAAETIAGTVVSTRGLTRGDSTIVDVEVPVAEAPTWAAYAARGEVALTLETRER